MKGASKTPVAGLLFDLFFRFTKRKLGGPNTEA